MKKLYGVILADEGMHKTYEEALKDAKERSMSGGGGGLFGGGGPESALVVKIVAKVDPPASDLATVTEIK